MSSVIRTAWPQDLDRLARFAAAAQADPDRFCAHASEDADAIAGDVRDVSDWTATAWVALDDERRLLGWLLAETDVEMGRAWWWGPFVGSTAPDGAAVADALARSLTAGLADYGEHELAVDARSTFMERFARRHDFAAEEGSVLLHCDLGDVAAPVAGGDVELLPIAELDRSALDALVALHDELFPGVHTPGALLVSSASDRRHRIAAMRDGGPVGYVATELQNDGSVYIDFLGVAPAERRRGLGRLLIADSLRRAVALDASFAHLTVRSGLTAARRLYASVGFEERRVVTPFRRGFSLS